MTSRQESTAAAPLPPSPPLTVNPLDSWEELQPFRETFLRHFTGDGDREALLKVGALAFEVILDFCHHWPQTEEPELLEIVRTAAADVRYVQGFVAHASMESGSGSMDDRRREVYLLARSAEWADQLGEIAAEMEEAVSE